MISARVIKSTTSLFYSFLDWIFTFSYNSAFQLIVLGRDMKQLLSNKTHRPIIIIENWAELHTIQPLGRKTLDQFIPGNHIDDLVFLFAGNFGRVQAIPELVDFIDKMDDQKVSFVFAGKGHYESMLRSMSQKNGNVFYLGSFKREDQIEVLNACDVALVSLSKGMYGLGVPSKTYNLLAAGKPILYIGEIDSEIDLLVKEHNIGWTINDYKAETFKDVVSDIMENRKILLEISQRARKLAEDEYSQKTILKKYYKILS